MAANLVESLILTNSGVLLGLPRLNTIDQIVIDTTIEEIYEDTVDITHHPVQVSAPITDHSFKRPMEVLLRCGWSDSSIGSFLGSFNSLLTGAPISQSSGQWTGGTMAASDYVAGIYSQLLQLQESRNPFALITGLRSYDDMLIKTLRVRRDERTQAVLMVEAFCQQVILVSTTSVTVPPQTDQATPAVTADTVNAGAQQLQSGTPAPGGALNVVDLGK